MTIDGVVIDVAPGSVAAIDRLRQRLEAQDGTIAALRAQVPDDAALDALVAERATVLERAGAAFGAGFAPQGLGTAAIRRAVVSHVLGADLAARGDAYVAAAFDALGAVATRNPLASHLAAADPHRTGDAARRDRDRFLTRAWKGDQPHGAR